MASLFDLAAGRSSVAVNRVNGVPYRYLPMTRPADSNARTTADPDRAEKDIIAAPGDLFARGASGPVQTTGVVNERLAHSSSRPQLSIDRADIPFEPRTLDRLRRISDGKLFSIAEIRRDDPARFYFDVNAL